MSKTITLRGLRLREVTEIAPNLFTGRDDEGYMRLFTNECFRGYATPWPTKAKPNGFRCDVFTGEVSVRFERQRIGRRFAEKLLVAKGLELCAGVEPAKAGELAYWHRAAAAPAPAAELEALPDAVAAAILTHGEA